MYYRVTRIHGPCNKSSTDKAQDFSEYFAYGRNIPWRIPVVVDKYLISSRI